MPEKQNKKTDFVSIGEIMVELIQQRIFWKYKGD